MKKFILSLGLVAMMLNLTNCAQYEDVNPTVEPQGDFEIYASATRTANDGLNTVWSTGDALNVFHAVGESTTYVSDGEFKLESAETGRFLGTLNGTLDVEEEYDWYAFYPYSKYIKTPASTSSGFMVVGHAASSSTDPTFQTQNGNNSTIHLAGTYCPLVGVVKAVGAGVAPTIEMNNLTSVLEFEVTNSLEEAITVSEISFTAPVDIVGTYYINFVDLNDVVYTGSGEQYVSNTATVKVENGAAIAAGTSATFYLAVKPFTAAAGKELSIVVSASSNTGLGTHEKKITLTSDVKFTAGKIKPVKVNYTTVIEAPAADETTATLSFANKAQRTSYNSSKQVWEQNGITLVNEKGSSTSNVGDYANPARFYKSSKITITAPGNIKEIVFTASGYTDPLKSSVTAEEVTASVSGTKVTIIPASQSNTFVINSLTGGQVRASDVTVTYVTGGSSEGGETPETPATPVLTITTTAPIEVGAEGDVATVAYTITNPVAGHSVTASADQTWVNTFDCSVAGEVSFAVDANTGAAREATVTLSYDGATAQTIKISQAAGEVVEPENPGTEATKKYTFSSYTAGTQYAKNEAHKLDDVLTITTTECHFTSELRIYSSSTHNGYAIGTLAGGATIKSLGFNAGNKVDTLNVYGSTDGSTWTLVSEVSITSTSYNDYSVDFGNTNYTHFKLDVKGANQVRLKTLTLTYVK